MENNTPLKTVPLLVTTAILSIIFNYFFLWSHLGISILLFNAMLLSVNYFILKARPNFKKMNFFIVAIVLIILAIPYLRFDFWLFKVINSLLIFLMYGYLANNLLQFNLGYIIKAILQGIFVPLSKMHCFFQDASSDALKKSKNFTKIMLGLLFSSLVLIIVIPLLLSSDSVFKGQLNLAFGFMDLFKFNKLILRAIVFFLFVSYLYSQFKHTLTPVAGVSTKWSYKFDPIVSNAFLISIDVVYVLFSFIQVKYLFLGNTLPEGMTYAEYARQGFFQLVFVTVINLLIIILFNQFKQNRLITNSLLLVTIICTFIMTLSAFFRMNLYESTYGYTQLRLLVYLFLIGEILVLIPMIIGVLKPNFRFLEYTFFTVFIYYLLVTFVNIDGFVADKNVDRFIALSASEREDFDIKYLDELSKDALPKIDELITLCDEETALFFKETILIKYVNDYYPSKWYEYNLSNKDAKTIYEKYYPQGYDKNAVPTHYRAYGDY